MHAQRGKLVSGGRLQVPADVRRELGIADGDPLIMRVVDGELRVRPLRYALARVRERLRPHVQGPSLSEELISERRRDSDVE